MFNKMMAADGETINKPVHAHLRAPVHIHPRTMDLIYGRGNNNMLTVRQPDGSVFAMTETLMTGIKSGLIICDGSLAYKYETVFNSDGSFKGYEIYDNRGMVIDNEKFQVFYDETLSRLFILQTEFEP